MTISKTLAPLRPTVYDNQAGMENLSLASPEKSMAPSPSTISPRVFKKVFNSREFNINYERNRILHIFMPLKPKEISGGLPKHHKRALMHADLLFLRFLKNNKALCTKHTGAFIQLAALITVLKYNHDAAFNFSAIQPASISLDRLECMERLFLKAIDWNILVNSLEDLDSEREELQLALKPKN